MRNDWAMERACHLGSTGANPFGGLGATAAQQAISRDGEAGEARMSWKIEVVVDDSGEWEGDPLRFETQREALAYARNLEAQARVDTYLVLSKFVHLLCGKGKVSPAIGRWLRRQVFDASHRRFSTPHMRERYGSAQKCALAVLRRLRRVPLEERRETLCHFRALSWPGKQAFVGMA